ncbi:MarR family winged helix-turn-helix transcriptional regulator [Actinoplanes sp. G11-F43]|uniref:MarR family winged helix-turn-helix transcriptional regulator n=1 Tax=Actinoplanes sp. G11-F43 TaxID=3424130 RepID=UPI003D356DEF
MTLVEALHDAIKAVRLLKQAHPVQAPIGVLAAIRRRESAGCHMKELASAHALDPSTISRAVASLVRSGLVERIADPTDGRASILHVTETGHALLDQTETFYEARIAAALRDWTPEEINTFTTSLSRMAHDLITQEEVTQ